MVNSLMAGEEREIEKQTALKVQPGGKKGRSVKGNIQKLNGRNGNNDGREAVDGKKQKTPNPQKETQRRKVILGGE